MNMLTYLGSILSVTFIGFAGLAYMRGRLASFLIETAWYTVVSALVSLVTMYFYGVMFGFPAYFAMSMLLASRVLDGVRRN